MSDDDLPARPRLGDHVLARKHVVDGELRVVLHDTRRDGVVQVGPREWGLLAAADGTRDLEGIVLAAAREGARARPFAARVPRRAPRRGAPRRRRERRGAPFARRRGARGGRGGARGSALAAARGAA